MHTRLPIRWVLFLVLAARLFAADYFPPRGSWERHDPAAAGLDPAALQAAVAHAIAHENPATRDMAKHLTETFGAREPGFQLLGPTRPRGDLTGLVIHRGYVVAAWGDPDRVDMSHSITKTFLTTVVGLAHDRGLIPDLAARVAGAMPEPELFAGEHNGAITWDHLLRQTSDWSGTLWGVPDWADRPVGATPADYPRRALHPPGTFYKYNDVRVNLLALAALHVWREPLPEVLREEVMDPIGASSTWRWLGYENSWITLDGLRVQSVSGGGHFGGGMFINAWDLARFGYLFLRRGEWAGQRIISENWIALARTPGPANAGYGFANWFLNPGRKSLPAAPASAVVFRGNGQNIIYVDWDHDLIVVLRWLKDDEALNEFLRQLLAALPRPAPPGP